MNKSLLGASLVALALVAPAAHAHQPGDFIVRAGAITTAPNESSGDLRFDGNKVAGTKATLTSDTQLGLTFAYMLSDHIGVELLAATPFQHTVGVKGLGGGLDGKLADINYTLFFDEDLSSARKQQGFSNLKMQDSIGIAGQVGMDYMITDNVLVNASVWYVDIDTKATVDGPAALGYSKTKVDVEVDPWVYMVGIGYKF
jgi:outer membrane protein